MNTTACEILEMELMTDAQSTPSESTPSEYDQQNELQKQLAERYNIIKLLGKGAQGSVFLAKSLATHQKVAIKQLQIQSVKDWKMYDLFQREANTLKRIDIPGVAKLHETLELLDIEKPMALIIQDYIDGEPMQAFIAKGHRFQLHQIGDILTQLIDILDKLHHSNPVIIHRDIKPSNIVLNYEENGSIGVHLIDFGAVSNPQVKGGGSTVVGTYGYMAPEQLMGNANPSSDLYSLAIVAVYLLSGVPPEQLEIQDYHVLIDTHLEHLPYPITAFLRAMLAPRSEERMRDYTKIRQFATALAKQDFSLVPVIQNDTHKNSAFSIDAVYSFRQTGNIELWQALPDKTPRPFEMKNFSKTFRKQQRSIILKKNKALFNNLATSAVATLMFFITKLFVSSDFINYGTIVMFVVLVLITALLLINLSIGAHQIIFNPIRADFFKNARKSMATIIRIEYNSISKTQQDHDYINQLKSGNHQTYPASWTITYSFNPPDDLSPDDLIHTYETSTLPDIKEGDLIPILYRITDIGTENEQVTSMPWPIPIYDEINI